MRSKQAQRFAEGKLAQGGARSPQEDPLPKENLRLQGQQFYLCSENVRYYDPLIVTPHFQDTEQYTQNKNRLARNLSNYIAIKPAVLKNIK